MTVKNQQNKVSLQTALLFIAKDNKIYSSIFYDQVDKSLAKFLSIPSLKLLRQQTSDNEQKIKLTYVFKSGKIYNKNI